MLFPVIEIFQADIYRDGGSRSFCYYSDDENWYEFFLRIKGNEGNQASYDPPKLYRGSVNDRTVVHEFTWDEAADFVSGLQFDHFRFAELVEVVAAGGNGFSSVGA